MEQIGFVELEKKKEKKVFVFGEWAESLHLTLKNHIKMSEFCRIYIIFLHGLEQLSSVCSISHFFLSSRWNKNRLLLAAMNESQWDSELKVSLHEHN